MNVILWVTQAVLALLCVSGGAYKTLKFGDLANQIPALSRGSWRALGVFEIVCGILLVVPAAAKWKPVLTPLAAAALVLETLALSGVYARYSLKFTAANPLVWGVAMTLMAVLVAYGRY
jgi:hypothetical protein